MIDMGGGRPSVGAAVTGGRTDSALHLTGEARMACAGGFGGPDEGGVMVLDDGPAGGLGLPALEGRPAPLSSASEDDDSDSTAFFSAFLALNLLTISIWAKSMNYLK